MIKSRCCKNVKCIYEDNVDEQKVRPCWGHIYAVDEVCNEDYSDCYWIHACEGHANIKDYIPEND